MCKNRFGPGRPNPPVPKKMYCRVGQTSSSVRIQSQKIILNNSKKYAAIQWVEFLLPEKKYIFQQAVQSIEKFGNFVRRRCAATVVQQTTERRV